MAAAGGENSADYYNQLQQQLHTPVDSMHTNGTEEYGAFSPRYELPSSAHGNNNNNSSGYYTPTSNNNNNHHFPSSNSPAPPQILNPRAVSYTSSNLSTSPSAYTSASDYTSLASTNPSVYSSEQPPQELLSTAYRGGAGNLTPQYGGVGGGGFQSQLPSVPEEQQLLLLNKRFPVSHHLQQLSVSSPSYHPQQQQQQQLQQSLGFKPQHENTNVNILSRPSSGYNF
jgi:hypothetical protein